jgi:hypothetical protein
MTLLNPIWLWALGGLAIPVAIHLLSRKEGKTIRIGSIRFLAETSTSKFSSIRLNEVALLVMRSLLIILIVLFLATVLLSSTNYNTSQKWVVIEKGLENNDQIKKLLDSLQKDDFVSRRLSTGFPLLNDDTVTQAPDYYRLSEELSQKNNVQAIVIAGNLLSNFKGKRISLPDNITWLSYSISSAEVLPADSLKQRDTVRIMLAYDKEFQYDKKILLAALHALQSVAPVKILIEEIKIDSLKPSNTNWLIWLSSANLTYEGKSLRFRGDALSDLIVQENKNHWIITRRLNEENAIKHHLSVQLMSMLFDEQIKQEIRKHDKRIISDKLAWSNYTNIQSNGMLAAGHSVDKILIYLIVLTFIAERILAFYRKQ